MSLINISNLTFSYEGSFHNIFENVSFQIDTDWKLGFTGRNGRGKTTFLKLLMGKYEYSGTISSNVSFEYFPYDVPDADFFVIDVIHEISPNAQDWEIARELSLLNVSDDLLYRSYSTLSKGEQTKALLAALFLKENSFLLIDEPTNHLDTLGRKTLSDYLKRKHGFILVSHDRVFLDNCIDHILVINKTNIEVQRGNFSSWWRNKEMQDSFERAENEKHKKEISRLTAAAQKTSGWSDRVEKSKNGSTNSGSKLDKGYVGHKAAKMMKRSKAIENRQQDLIHEKSKLLKNLETAESLKLSPLPYHTSRLLELSDVSIAYGSRAVCSNISFTIEQGDRIALQGKNGSGKSSILKLICGENIPYQGILRKSERLKISYVPQSTAGLNGPLSEYIERNLLDESLFKAILRKFDFPREQFEKRLDEFSEGQKKKVLLARSLCEQAHLYIWDEPLNYIDVLSRMQIENLLLEYKPTILFVEHDSAFCENIATKTVEL